jgi:hypothetical protein
MEDIRAMANTARRTDFFPANFKRFVIVIFLSWIVSYSIMNASALAGSLRAKAPAQLAGLSMRPSLPNMSYY